MEQEIRFCELDGRRIAYATIGEGPLLVFGGRWVTHLEEEWDDPRARAFYEELARTHRVVRYDRLGAGLSDRELHGAADDRVRDARARGRARRVRRRAGDAVRLLVRRPRDVASREPRSPSACARSSSSAATSSRDDIPDGDAPVARRLRARELAARRADARGPVPPARQRRRDRRVQPLPAPLRRRGRRRRVPRARPDVRLRARSCRASTMPVLVLHRRGDRTVPIGRGRELASLLPNARFVALGGDSHLPWMDDQRELQRALAGFLDDAVAGASRTATRRSAAARPRCCASSPPASRTARSRRRSSSASTRCTGTSRTSCAS